MKKLGIFLLLLTLLFGFLPQTALAAEGSVFEEDVNMYLSKVSEERGFEVTREDLDAYLSANDLNLSSFTSVEEMRMICGTVIKADLSNLNGIYKTYNLDESSLNQLLSDKGEELKDYIYLNDLDYAIYFYTYDNTFEQDPEFDNNLVDYLTAVSLERGFTVTKEMLSKALSIYGTDLDTFKSVDELKDYMGDVIKADLSNLSIIYDSYDLDQETLFALLKQNGKSINDYIFVYDLNEIAYSDSEDYPVMDEAMLAQLLKMMDLSEAEIKNLENYFSSMEDYYTSPAFIDGLTSLLERLFETIEGMDPNAEITEEQAQQMAAYLSELFDLMKLRFEITVFSDGKEISLPISDLLLMSEFNTSINKIKLTIYGENNIFLADYYMSQDIIDYLMGKPSDIGNEIEEIIDQKPAGQKNVVPKTEDGGKLPKTSTNYIPGAILGGLLAVAGVLMYKRTKNDKKESAK
jgi:processed acidic surface protein